MIVVILRPFPLDTLGKLQPLKGSKRSREEREAGNSGRSLKQSECTEEDILQVLNRAYKGLGWL